MNKISHQVKTILIVSKHLIFGGTEKYTLNLVNALTEKGINVVLITGDGPLVKHVSSKVKMYILPISRNMRIKQFVEKKILEIAQIHKPELIHSDSRTSMVCAQLARTELNIPLITHEHHMYNKRDYPFIISELKEGADCIVTIGPYTKKMLVLHGMEREKVIAITNGVNIADLSLISESERKEARRLFGFRDTDTIVLCISRIVYGKGLDKLILGFKQVVKRFKSAKLLIVGDDEEFDNYKKNLEQLIVELKLQKHVSIFPGDFYIRKYHALADIFCYPALAKGMSVMEAMASGLPVVGKKTIKKPLAVEHMISGLMTDSTSSYKIDPGQLAEKLSYLIKNPSMRKEMGLKARQRIEKMYSLDIHLKKLNKVYLHVLSSHQEKESSDLKDFTLPFNKALIS